MKKATQKSLHGYLLIRKASPCFQSWLLAGKWYKHSKQHLEKNTFQVIISFSFFFGKYTPPPPKKKNK
jgi:uncharacterized membrane protein YbaN (DUF454 family)